MNTRIKSAAAMRMTFGMVVFGAILCATMTKGQEPAADVRVTLETRTYDVNDLLWWPADADGADETRKARSDSFIKVFTETIEPGKWAGPAAINSIEERDGRLIVIAKADTHAMLNDMLGQFRETTALQGVSVDCHFILADEAFVRLRAPAVLGRKERGAIARGMGPFAARSIVEAARETPGVVVIPAPPLPLYALPSSLLIGEERRIKLPLLGAEKGAAVEVSRPAGLSVSLCGHAERRYVTLDLMVRSGTLDRVAGVGGVPDGYDEIEGLYHGTFAVERSGAFLVCAPLVKAKLTALNQTNGAAEGVAREIDAAQPDLRRYLLFAGMVRSMSTVEATLLAGARVAKLLDERFPGPDKSPPSPALLPPGIPPRIPPPPPQAPPPESTMRVYDLRGLLLGSERGEQRAPARVKRLEHILSQIKATLGDDPIAFSTQYGQLIVTGKPWQYARISTVLDALAAERLIDSD